jgi:acetyl-CoA carboxylase biotin carboxylase subunit
VFKKVLVANRGEIAVRIMRTLREMGVASVAIHSETDTNALHVRTADESRCLGGAEPRDNYLDVEAIVAAVRDTGAEAVHPGYGFLSERPELPRALEKAGVTFIGPPAEVLARVGDKTEARRLMQAAGVPVIPGMDQPSDDPEVLAKAAEEMGYPVLIKAAAGGGGKGMRVVREPRDLAEAARQAGSEALASFGDGAVYLERYLDRPRHVEVQILADSQGHVVHLFERECSLQRRHQKIVEESPSPALDEGLRQKMGQAAVEAARVSGFVNAGSVEFLLDREGHFYFLEVNARLQVEHAVTELITGLDLVRLQLEIAAGAELPFTQDQVVRRGHAIECRLYAEDHAADFAPSPGRIALFKPPSGPGVRLDEGITSGSEVPLYYDPILAKLIVWAGDRPAAIERMIRALEETTILGVRTPVELLIHLISSDQFRSGQTHTGLVDELRQTWKPRTEEDELALLAVLVRELGQSKAAAAGPGEPAGWPTPWQSLGEWDLVTPGRR